MSNVADYENHLKEMEMAHETLCKRCGACCGSNDADPCVRLLKDDKGRYYCSVYESRLGLQRTVSDQEFSCVPLRSILFEPWAGSWKCNYK